MSLASGTRIGNYEVLAPLGAGGMGEVYRARDVRLERIVALKALPPAFAADPDRRARFEREARLLAAVPHPNIATIFGIEDAEGATLLVLEFVEGESLADRLRTGALSVARTLEIGGQIAAAIAAAHEQGVVHRDLKPGNVMLSPSGVKVLDFGLAKGAASTSSVVDLASVGPTVAPGVTAAGVIVGTAPYMSPEQARGHDVDRRTDVWALGCILFECLSGKQAFSGETATDVLARVLEREPDWNALPASTPTRLRDLLRRCLTKTAAERPRDAGDLRGEMAAIAADLSSGTSMILPVGGPPSVAVLYFENLSPGDESEYFCAGITEDILTDLSKLRQMKVASRNAVARYRGKNVDIAQVAKELGVGFVLEGSVRRAGDRVRITAQLISADGFHLWADRFDRTLEDVFAVQDEIAAAIAGALKVTLSPADEERRVESRPQDVRAYDLYLKGRELYYRYDKASLGEAVRLFRQAIELDPGYALAYAGLADTYGQQVQWGTPSVDDSLLREALVAARRAIELAPGLAEGHKAEALVLHQMGNAPAALASIRRAVEADPRHLPAVANYGVYLYGAGNVAGAERMTRRCLEIDATDFFAHVWLASILMDTGRFAEAGTVIAHMEALAETPLQLSARWFLDAMLALLCGEYARLPGLLDAGNARGGEKTNFSLLEAYVLLRDGQVEQARKLVDRAYDAPGIYIGGITFASITLAALGEPARAAAMYKRPVISQMAATYVRLTHALHPLLEYPPLAPPKADFDLVWPIEAPMIDAVRLKLFRSVRLDTGRPTASGLLEGL